MTEAVFQFKAIARKLNRQEQKAEFEEKNPPIPDTSMYGWPYGVAVSVTSDSYTPPEWLLNQVPLSDLMGSAEAGRLTGILTGGASTPMLGAAELPPYTPSQGVASPLVDLSRMVEWRRVNGELREYAIQQGPHGDEFVKMTDGTCLSRPIDFNAPPSFMGVKI
jgi:hypothetical protein